MVKKPTSEDSLLNIPGWLKQNNKSVTNFTTAKVFK
jgi:hypothetical protein